MKSPFKEKELKQVQKSIFLLLELLESHKATVLLGWDLHFITDDYSVDCAGRFHDDFSDYDDPKQYCQAVDALLQATSDDLSKHYMTYQSDTKNNQNILALAKEAYDFYLAILTFYNKGLELKKDEEQSLRNGLRDVARSKKEKVIFATITGAHKAISKVRRQRGFHELKSSAYRAVMNANLATLLDELILDFILLHNLQTSQLPKEVHTYHKQAHKTLMQLEATFDQEISAVPLTLAEEPTGKKHASSCFRFFFCCGSKHDDDDDATDALLSNIDMDFD